MAEKLIYREQARAFSATETAVPEAVTVCGDSLRTAIPGNGLVKPHDGRAKFLREGI